MFQDTPKHQMRSFIESPEVIIDDFVLGFMTVLCIKTQTQQLHISATLISFQLKRHTSF